MTDLVSIQTLPNGLRYLTVPMPGVQSVTVLALIKAGTRYERPSTNGISHFLEHAVSKGTHRFPTSIDIALAIDNIGGRNNAYTSKESTGYFVKSAAEHMELGLKVVSELIFHPTLPEADLDIERGVILEEIRMYEDDPQGKISRIFEEVMFDPTALGWNTLGSFETIQGLKRPAFLEYMEYMYTPNKIVLVIAGGVEGIGQETEEKTREQKNTENTKAQKTHANTEYPIPNTSLQELIHKYFGVQKQNTKLSDDTFQFHQTKPHQKLVTKDTEQCHLVFGYRTFGRGSTDRYVLSVLSVLLGGGMSSRLFMEIREKRGLAYYVGAYPQTYAESGYLAMVAGTKPDSAQEVLTLAQAEFMKLADKKVSAKELQKAKSYIKGHLVLNWEDSFEVAEFYGEDLLMEDRLRTPQEVLKEIDAVTAEDVQRLAKQIFVDKGKNMAAIGPEKFVEKLKI